MLTNQFDLKAFRNLKHSLHLQRARVDYFSSLNNDLKNRLKWFVVHKGIISLLPPDLVWKEWFCWQKYSSEGNATSLF